MNQSMQILTILAMTYTALSALCFSMDKHYQNVFNNEPLLSRQRLLYWGGWLLCIISAIWAIKLWGTAIGVVAWFGCLTVMQMTVILILTYTKVAKASLAVGLAVTLLAFSVDLLMH